MGFRTDVRRLPVFGLGCAGGVTGLAVARRLAAARPGARVLLCSSAAVYGHGDGTWRETAAPDPVSPYGKAKLAMEQLATGLRPDIRLTILRIGNVAGADAILGGWRPGFTLDVLPDGRTPRRSYVGPGAFAAILDQLVACWDLPDLINFALPADVEMGDLLDHAGMDWTARAAAPDSIARVCLDVTRLQDVLGGRLAPATAAAIVADFRAFSS
jgi:nucleoside-diphosphate-sugar epimerase